MNKHVEKAIEMMNAAKPASGVCPQTEAEWVKLQHANVELQYAMFRSMGKTDKEARNLASVMGGSAGRMLLELVFQMDNREPNSTESK